MNTDIRKAVAAFGIMLAAAASLCADWRTDVAAIFTAGGDYARASEYIQGIYEDLDEDFAPTLCALLAFCHSRMNQPPVEKKWIIRLFEKYRGMGTTFSFLDSSTQMQLSTFLGKWHQVYPLVADLFLVEQKTASAFSPPANIVIGVEMTNPAYFRLIKNGQIVLGSMFHKGFNIIRVDASLLFSRPGIHVYQLQLKTDNLDLNREVRLDVEVTSPRFRTSPEAPTKKIEYTLSLFVGEEMISSLRKIERLQTPLKLGLSNNALKGGRFDPLHRADPQGHPDPLGNSISIPGLIAGVASLIKDLVGKKEKPSGEPNIIKSMEQEFRYMRRLYGMDQETTARIKLQSSSLDLSQR